MLWKKVEDCIERYRAYQKNIHFLLLSAPTSNRDAEDDGGRRKSRKKGVNRSSEASPLRVIIPQALCAHGATTRSINFQFISNTTDLKSSLIGERFVNPKRGS
ncbi:hypothetical protein V1478_002009 [Vespula squamosa]|uniref:Uncharacterized protein n=1 Tax=Vespula squamosa TaxID=30214 RepID=A0ABD2BYS2_VESSQ